MNPDLTEITTHIATDLWHRFRLIASVIEKSEGFVAMPAGGSRTGRAGPDTERPPTPLPAEEPEIRNIASAFILRAFQIAFDPANNGILQQLERQGALSFEDLRSSVGLDRVSAHERINDLIQVGLTARDFESGRVQITPGGEALIQLLRQIEDGVVALARSGRTGAE